MKFVDEGFTDEYDMGPLSSGLKLFRKNVERMIVSYHPTRLRYVALVSVCYYVNGEIFLTKRNDSDTPYFLFSVDFIKQKISFSHYVLIYAGGDEYFMFNRDGPPLENTTPLTFRDKKVLDDMIKFSLSS